MLSDEYCPIHLNWNVLRRRWDNATKLHWSYTRAVWRRKKIYSLASSVTWPLRVPVFAWIKTSRWGPQVKKKTGISLGRQFLDQLYVAIRHFVPPSGYYIFSLYSRANRSSISKYIYRHEIIELLLFLNNSIDSGVFDDKREFCRECKRLGLPTIPILANFEQGRINWRDDGDKKLPKVDLFAKPALGTRGQGVKRWIYEKERDRYSSENGDLLMQEQIIEHLLESSRKQPYILQENLRNHPNISGLSLGGLCNVRVLTACPPDGRPEYIGSQLNMPLGKSLASNIQGRSIAAPVRKSDGALGRAIATGLDADRLHQHPDTGNKIVGVRVPHWNEIIQLCLQAHGAFPVFTSVGWDVAITEKGPVIVEGNPVWGVDNMQRIYKPLGDSRIAEILVLHIEQRENFK